MDELFSRPGVMLGIIALFFFFYFLPTIVAIARSHKNKLAIFVVNLFLGFTGLFWILALVWACIHQERQKKSITNYYPVERKEPTFN